MRESSRGWIADPCCGLRLRISLLFLRRYHCHGKKTGKRARIQSNYSATGGDRRVGRPSAKQRKPYNPDAILDVAVRVFRERGYDGSTLDDVARAAGITKASIYY
ncbi:TetR/AcrR family transcriptional regulator, partial [Candidatus Binatus sp.]